MQSRISTTRSSLLMSALLVAAGCAGAPTVGTVEPSLQPTQSTTAQAPTASPRLTAPPSPSVVEQHTPSASVGSELEPIHVAAVPAEPALDLEWESAGSAPSQACTAGPTIDPDGRLWVLACWENVFWIFQADGTFVEQWGSGGSGDGQLDFAWGGGDDAIGGVAFAPDGSFYTVDGGNLRVQHFDGERNLLSSWGGFGRADGQFAKPTAIAVDSNGQIYVVDSTRNDVQVFDSDGSLVMTVAGGMSQGGFGYMAVGDAGDVFLSAYYQGRRSILHYLPDGTLGDVYDLSAVASDHAGMALDEDSHLFVAAFDASTDRPSGTLEIDLTTGDLLHRWPATGEMLAFDPTRRALDATHYLWSFARQYALPGD